MASTAETSVAPTAAPPATAQSSTTSSPPTIRPAPGAPRTVMLLRKPASPSSTSAPGLDGVSGAGCAAPSSNRMDVVPGIDSGSLDAALAALSVTSDALPAQSSNDGKPQLLGSNTNGTESAFTPPAMATSASASTSASVSPPETASAPASTTGPSHAQLDETLSDALKGPRDRVFLLKQERDMIAFVKDASRTRWDLPLMNSYQRLLVHRCADLFGVQHDIDPSTKAVTLTKGAESRVPDLSLSQQAELARATLAPSPSEPSASFKIMRREPGKGAGRRNGSGSLPGSGEGTDAEGGPKDRRHMTIEEREAAYREARSRIFQGFEEKEREKSKDKDRDGKERGKERAEGLSGSSGGRVRAERRERSERGGGGSSAMAGGAPFAGLMPPQAATPESLERAALSMNRRALPSTTHLRPSAPVFAPAPGSAVGWATPTFSRAYYDPAASGYGQVDQHSQWKQPGTYESYPSHAGFENGYGYYSVEQQPSSQHPGPISLSGRQSDANGPNAQATSSNGGGNVDAFSPFATPGVPSPYEAPTPSQGQGLHQHQHQQPHPHQHQRDYTFPFGYAQQQQQQHPQAHAHAQAHQHQNMVHESHAQGHPHVRGPPTPVEQQQYNPGLGASAPGPGYQISSAPGSSTSGPSHPTASSPLYNPNGAGPGDGTTSPPNFNGGASAWPSLYTTSNWDSANSAGAHPSFAGGVPSASSTRLYNPASRPPGRGTPFGPVGGAVMRGTRGAGAGAGMGSRKSSSAASSIRKPSPVTSPGLEGPGLMRVGAKDDGTNASVVSVASSSSSTSSRSSRRPASHASSSGTTSAHPLPARPDWVLQPHPSSTTTAHIPSPNQNPAPQHPGISLHTHSSRSSSSATSGASVSVSGSGSGSGIGSSSGNDGVLTASAVSVASLGSVNAASADGGALESARTGAGTGVVNASPVDSDVAPSLTPGLDGEQKEEGQECASVQG